MAAVPGSASSLNSSSIPHFIYLNLCLDHTNYQYWRAQILSTVRADGFDGFLLGFESTLPRFVESFTGGSYALISNTEYV